MARLVPAAHFGNSLVTMWVSAEGVASATSSKMSSRGPHSEETKEKMRQAHLNKRHTLGELRSCYCPAINFMPYPQGHFIYVEATSLAGRELWGSG